MTVCEILPRTTNWTAQLSRKKVYVASVTNYYFKTAKHAKHANRTVQTTIDQPIGLKIETFGNHGVWNNGVVNKPPKTFNALVFINLV